MVFFGVEEVLGNTRVPRSGETQKELQGRDLDVVGATAVE
jgi:hypothetical protein